MILYESTMNRVLAAILFALVCQMAWPQDSPRTNAGGLTLDDVIAMSKAKLSEELIVTRVKKNNRPFELSSGELVELHKLGVTDTVIKFLVDPSLPYAPPTPAAPSPASSTVKPATKLPDDLASLDVPPEAGAYWMKAEKDFVKLDFKPLMPAQQSGGMISVLSGGLKKGHKLGVVAGATAPTRLQNNGSATFYLRLPSPQSIDDVVLFTFVMADARRSVDFGPNPGKPVFPLKAVKNFGSKEVSPGLFRINLTLTEGGEYGFFILGSGDEKRGTLGKAYAFGVN